MAVNTTRGRWRDARGAELIEFAMVLPIFLLLTAGIFDFGMMFRTYEAVTNAAREGARVGVLPALPAGGRPGACRRLHGQRGTDRTRTPSR